MKHLKYMLTLFLSFLPIGLIMGVLMGSAVIAINTKNYQIIKTGVIIALVLFPFALFLKNPLRNLRVKARRAVEYDEYGLSKTKGTYEYLSKRERDAIDLQKTADMERLVNTTAIKKMTKQGPKDPMKELDEMIGLEPVKQKIKEMVARMEFENEENKRKKKGARVDMTQSGRHMCFTGSAGTGKTTVARIMTGFLYKYGYIKENKCVEIDGNFLKAGTESALKTELILRHAYGGVLFIDEAYALVDSSDNSGEQVIATLIKQMEDQRGKFVLIIAGYTHEMKKLIATNTGFESRIKEYLNFPDYDAIEMREILQYMAHKNNFAVDQNAFDVYDAIVTRERRSRSFGNGRTARNILDKAIDRHTLNLATGVISKDDRYKLCSQDFQNIKLGGI